MKTIIAADLFCGAGGTSTGLVNAVRRLGFKLDLLAVNHWMKAVETHTRNHPFARHLCADLSAIDPNDVCPGGRLNILVASPECTHHSIARGGRPCSNQSRASSWHVLHWAERLRIENILLENVREFASWGPLNRRNRPDPNRKGETYQAFLQSLRSLGYTVEDRVLNAADYGDATTRKRLFIQASRSGRITWPTPSHTGKWKPAKDIINWKLQSRSIFDRKRPLAPKTLARIEAGLRKFGGQPFIAILRGYSNGADGYAHPVNDPLPTISANGQHSALCEPFVIGQQSGAVARSTEEPLPTVATAGAIALCQPFVFNVAHQGGDRTHSIADPLPTFPAGHRGELALCEPFVTKYYGSGIAKSIESPLDALTTKARFALVEPRKLHRKMDILFRMLQPEELAAAMGFEGYSFSGSKTDQVKQIGNAVAVHVAEALCTSILTANN